MATQTLTGQNGTVFAPRASQSAPSTQTPRERTKLYKDFLTPALHRRFTSAAGTVLGFCWLEAVLIGDKSSIFWSWFPLSVTGLRTLLLLLPCLAVFIVRVANIHVGERTSASVAEAVLALTAAKSLGGTVHTLGWYMWSGWFFGEVYIWASNPEDNLNWIDRGRSYEKPRLNENPVFLRCLFILLGVIQASRHLAADYDRVVLPLIDAKESQAQRETITDPEQPSSILEKLPRPFRVLSERAGGIFNRSLKLTLVGFLFVSLPVYFFFLRSFAWSWAYFVGSFLESDLPRHGSPSGFVSFGQLSWQAFSGSLLLGLLWEISNAAFDVFVTQPPTKKEHPLTNEIKDARGVVLHKSKDPNGSLISGLKSKKEVPRSFAFWELYIICTQFEARRKTIFTEVDRAGGSTWRQICDQCLHEISAITQRIKSVDSGGNVIVTAPKPQEPTDDAPAGLPKIASQGVREDGNILMKAKPDLAHTVGNLAKSIGQSPSGRDPVATLQRGADQLVPKESREKFVREQYAHANSYAIKFLQMPIGESFRQTFASRAVAIAFGTPHSRQTTVVHAARSLARLATCSLTEAQYGGVSRDIPAIVRAYTEAIRSLEKFVQTLPPHWTDVLFSPRDRHVPAIQHVLDVLKKSLEEIVLAFGEYAGELGLSKKEVREAREASARKAITSGASAQSASQKNALPATSSKPEMAQVQRRRI